MTDRTEALGVPTAPDVPTSLRDALADRYRIEREIGAGGMAAVYLATDLRHDRPVAIKIFREDHGVVLGAERFHREIRVLARLRHPFVLPLHDSGDVAGNLYFVMPYIDGESLRGRLARDTRLTPDTALEIVRQIADGLHYAHEEGVVHRDVKPENILLSRHGHALLADFGIARSPLRASGAQDAMTQVGIAVGTSAYMSPEQAMGEADIDRRADVYALGCVLYEMLTGCPPFVGPTALAVVAQHLTAPIPSVAAVRPDVAPAVDRAITCALAKDRTQRFESVAAFARELTTSGSGPAISTLATASSGRLSIAVLPIVNIGGNPDDEYFSDGLTEELTNALAKLEGLRVVSRTSTFKFRGRDAGIGEIGSALGVGFVLEASIRRAGQRLRLTAKLVRVSDDSLLWSETYERALDDVFAVQDEVTARIVETIAHALQLGHLRGQVPVRQPRSLAAYDLYLLGRHHWYKRTEDGMRRALELFEQAADVDPSYAPAHSGIADASALLASWQFADAAAMYPRAVAAARRALELDPSSADAHASLGFVKYNWEWDWAGTVRELRRAIELNPSHEPAHRWLSAFLAGTGRGAEALPIARRVLEIDPMSVLPRMNLGIVHLFSGHLDLAAAEVQRVIEMDPSFVRSYSFLAMTLASLGRHTEAITAAREAVERSKGHPMMRMTLGACLARDGRLDEAREILDPIAGLLPPIYDAMTQASLGNESAALDALERGYDERSDWMYTIATQPWFLGLHTHPRFVRLVERLGLTSALGVSS